VVELALHGRHTILHPQDLPLVLLNLAKELALLLATVLQLLADLL
jgi:hypothetical protein